MKAEEIELEFVCPKPDDELRPDGDRLYCDECDHRVTVLSTMTEDEAAAFVAAAQHTSKRICVAYDVDESGELFFMSQRLKLQLAGAATLVAGAALIVTSITTALGGPTPRERPPLHLYEHVSSSEPLPQPMPTPDPNAAFDSWEFAPDEDWLLVGEDAPNVLDIEELRAVQQARQDRINRPKGKVKRTKGVSKSHLRHTLKELEEIQRERTD